MTIGCTHGCDVKCARSGVDVRLCFFVVKWARQGYVTTVYLMAGLRCWAPGGVGAWTSSTGLCGAVVLGSFEVVGCLGGEAAFFSRTAVTRALADVHRTVVKEQLPGW